MFSWCFSDDPLSGSLDHLCISSAPSRAPHRAAIQTYPAHASTCEGAPIPNPTRTRMRDNGNVLVDRNRHADVSDADRGARLRIAARRRALPVEAVGDRARRRGRAQRLLERLAGRPLREQLCPLAGPSGSHAGRPWGVAQAALSLFRLSSHGVVHGSAQSSTSRISGRTKALEARILTILLALFHHPPTLAMERSVKVSTPYPPERILDAAKVGAELDQKYRPNTSPGRPSSGQNPAGRALGRPWTTPIVDILQATTPETCPSATMGRREPYATLTHHLAVRLGGAVARNLVGVGLPELGFSTLR